MSDDKPMVFLGTPDDKALVARLRAQDIALYHEAAATIERLTAENARLVSICNGTVWEDNERLRAEIREIRMQAISDNCQAQTAYEAQLAAEATIERLREENRNLRAKATKRYLGLMS